MDDRSRNERADAATGRPDTLVWILAAVACVVLIAWLWGRSVGTVAPGSVGIQADRDGPPGEVGPGRQGEAPLSIELSTATQAPVTEQDPRTPWEAPDVLVHLELEGAEDRHSGGWTFFASSREPLAAGEDPTPRLNGGLEIEYEWVRSPDEEVRAREFLESFRAAGGEVRVTGLGEPSVAEHPELLPPTVLAAWLRSPDTPAEVLAPPRPGVHSISIRPWIVEDVPERRVNLRACHPLYADAHVEIVPPRAVREALSRGETSVIEATMRVEGICILEGQVAVPNRASLGSNPSVPVPLAELGDEFAEAASIGGELMGGDALPESDRPQFGSSFLEGPARGTVEGGFVALFPLVAGVPAAQPIAESRWDARGSFRFEVPDPGPHVMVAVRVDRPPLTTVVDLHRRTVVRPGGELRFPSASGIEGRVVVEDRGVLRSCRIVADRDGDPADQDHPWGAAHGFVWGRHGFEVHRIVGDVDAGGGFYLPGLGPGTYRLHADLGSALDLRTKDAAAEEFVRAMTPSTGVVIRPSVISFEVDFDLSSVPDSEEDDVPGDSLSVSLRSLDTDVGSDFGHLVSSPLRTFLRVIPGDRVRLSIDSRVLEAEPFETGVLYPGDLVRRRILLRRP